jgi:hypothetical protein
MRSTAHIGDSTGEIQQGHGPVGAAIGTRIGAAAAGAVAAGAYGVAETSRIGAVVRDTGSPLVLLMTTALKAMGFLAVMAS